MLGRSAVKLEAETPQGGGQLQGFRVLGLPLKGLLKGDVGFYVLGLGFEDLGF